MALKQTFTVFINLEADLDTTLPDGTQVFCKDTNKLWVLDNGAYTQIGGGGSLSYGFAFSDETTQISTGTSKFTFFSPQAFTITSVQASLNQSGSSVSTFNVKKNGTTIFSTAKLTIDANEFSTGTAATPVVISGISVSLYDKLTVDVDTIGTGCAGGKVYIVGTT
jgi:hypothetical protein